MIEIVIVISGPGTVADPGFSEWEGVLFGQTGVLAVFDKKLRENENIYTKMGVMCPAHPFNQISCKKTLKQILYCTVLYALV